MMPVVLSVIGRKGSGKSEVLETLIALLKEKGFRVGVIKHLAKDDMEIDDPEKDTFRYRMRGAETVMLAGNRRLAVFSNLSEEIPLEKLLNQFEGFDLVFLEGYFFDSIPKIEIYKKDLGEPLSRGMENVFAVCSDERSGVNAPHFPIHQLFSLVSLIEEKFLCLKSFR